MNRYQWQETPAPESGIVEDLVERFALPAAGARMFAARSMTDAGSVERYLSPGPGDANDPFAFEHMERAVECVREAAREAKPVLIHGDYDVDGISGTALLYEYLEGMFDNIYRFLPDRRQDGYGVAVRAVDWAIEKGVGLFIAVDCGTSDGEVLSRLAERGVDVVVCDHHRVGADVNVPGVLLNPTREGESYPYPSLCGTGVAYKFIEALHQSGVRGRRAPDTLVDLMALATVGDLAALDGENRYYVRAGLERINRTPRPGIEAIKNFSRMGRKPVTATHISFVIAPRLNAPGRVSKPKPSLELLGAPDRETAARLAAQIESQNERRKDLTRAVHEAAEAKIREMPDAEKRGAFVLGASGWNEGVLGIAAARVAETHARPAILLAVEGDTAKGSGRSVMGVDLKSHVDRLAHLLVRYGGHTQAVGLSIQSDRIDEFAAGLSESLMAETGAFDGQPRLSIDSPLRVDECNEDLLNFFARCEPFGYGNREPVWKIADVQVLGDTCFVGGNHLKLYFQDTRGNPGEAIAFNWTRDVGPEELHGRGVDIAVRVRRGKYMNRTYPELHLVDIRLHGG